MATTKESEQSAKEKTPQTDPVKEKLQERQKDVSRWFASRYREAIESSEKGDKGDWLGISRDLVRLKQTGFTINKEKRQEIFEQVKRGIDTYKDDPIQFAEILTNLRVFDKTFDPKNYRQDFEAAQDNYGKMQLYPKLLQLAVQKKFLGFENSTDAHSIKILRDQGKEYLEQVKDLPPSRQARILARLNYLGVPLDSKVSDPIKKDIGKRLDEYGKSADTAPRFAGLYSLYNNWYVGGQRPLADDERERLHRGVNDLTDKGLPAEFVPYAARVIQAEQADKQVRARSTSSPATPEENAVVAQAELEGDRRQRAQEVLDQIIKKVKEERTQAPEPAAPHEAVASDTSIPAPSKGRTDNLGQAFERAIQKQREREKAAKKTIEPEPSVAAPEKKESPVPPAPEPVSNPEPPPAREPETGPTEEPEPEPEKAPIPPAQPTTEAEEMLSSFEKELRELSPDQLKEKIEYHLTNDPREDIVRNPDKHKSIVTLRELLANWLLTGAAYLQDITELSKESKSPQVKQDLQKLRKKISYHLTNEPKEERRRQGIQTERVSEEMARWLHDSHALLAELTRRRSRKNKVKSSSS